MAMNVVGTLSTIKTPRDRRPPRTTAPPRRRQRDTDSVGIIITLKSADRFL